MAPKGSGLPTGKGKGDGGGKGGDVAGGSASASRERSRSPKGTDRGKVVRMLAKHLHVEVYGSNKHDEVDTLKKAMEAMELADEEPFINEGEDEEDDEEYSKKGKGSSSAAASTSWSESPLGKGDEIYQECSQLP